MDIDGGAPVERHRRVPLRASTDALLLCGVIALCAAVAAGLAWTRATSLPRTTSYTQTGRLAYRAATPSGSVYGAAGLRTGQPVYWNVVTTFTVTYHYRFSASAPVRLTGSEQLVATMSNGQGISRSLPIQPPTSFTHGQFVATGTLSHRALGAIATMFGLAAGSSPAGYTVAISPEVKVSGRLASAPVRTTFDPVVAFTYDTTSLTPSTASSGTTSSSGNGSGTRSGGHPFSAVSSASIREGAGAPGKFLGLPLSAARLASSAVLLVALLAVTFLGRSVFRRLTSEDERLRIATRYSSLLVEAEAIPPSNVALVPLRSFEGLAKVARRVECPIVHVQDDDGDVYAVVDNGTVYRYRRGGSALAWLDLPPPSGNGRHHTRYAGIAAEPSGE